VIAADTSTWVAFLEGRRGADVDALDKSLANRQVIMPPIVLTELLSDQQLPSALAQMLADIPRANPDDDYWIRAGKLRVKILAGRRKARLGDALIAQSCLDAGIPLITRDRDFRAFARAAKLNLVFESGSAVRNSGQLFSCTRRVPVYLSRKPESVAGNSLLKSLENRRKRL